MDEPKCPTCGSKCIKVYDTTRPDLFRFIALLQLRPDLTKLREVLDEYNPDNDDPDYPTSWWDTYRKFYQAVKELLEGAK